MYDITVLHLPHIYCYDRQQGCLTVGCSTHLYQPPGLHLPSCLALTHLSQFTFDCIQLQDINAHLLNYINTSYTHQWWDLYLVSWSVSCFWLLWVFNHWTVHFVFDCLPPVLILRLLFVLWFWLWFFCVCCCSTPACFTRKIFNETASRLPYTARQMHR